MSKELNFDGYWTGEAIYECDCPGCHVHYSFPFTSEEEAKNSKEHIAQIRKDCEWIVTKVNGQYREFCSYKCRDKFIRMNTL